MAVGALQRAHERALFRPAFPFLVLLLLGRFIGLVVADTGPRLLIHPCHCAPPWAPIVDWRFVSPVLTGLRTCAQRTQGRASSPPLRRVTPIDVSEKSYSAAKKSVALRCRTSPKRSTRARSCASRPLLVRESPHTISAASFSLPASTLRQLLPRSHCPLGQCWT